MWKLLQKIFQISNSAFCCQYPWCDDVRKLYPSLLYFYNIQDEKNYEAASTPSVFLFSANLVCWVWVGCRIAEGMTTFLINSRYWSFSCAAFTLIKWPNKSFSLISSSFFKAIYSCCYLLSHRLCWQKEKVSSIQ